VGNIFIYILLSSSLGDFETKLISRGRNIRKQWEDNKILRAKYNKREIVLKGRRPCYLRKENLEKVEKEDDGVRALVKLR